ncbi:protein NYNRIN-like [Podarcis lilfordi]|uniref:ribonuclease H n=1 Tax=Podarcis lilfordi TaxID=74358 RepID=A0AA35PV99_9SAUR|nr:protein NYNRIN-like [Podarcis lilfordi]
MQALRTYLADERPQQLYYLNAFVEARKLFHRKQAQIVRQMAVLKTTGPPPYDEIKAQEEQLDRSLIPFYYPEPMAPPPPRPGAGDRAGAGAGTNARPGENLTNPAAATPSLNTPVPSSLNLPQGTWETGEDQTDPNMRAPLNEDLSNGERDGPVSSRTRNRDNLANGEVEGAFPLRALPIPPTRAGDPPPMVFTHQPFLTADLMNWSDKMPSLRDDPDKCHRQVATIFSTHNPTWADVHMLLGALFNEAEKREILVKVGEALTRVDYQPGRPASMAPLTAQNLINDPDWDYNTDNGIWGLKIFKKAILDGIKAAGQRTVNWTNVQAVLQGPDEHPADYYTRLVSAIKTWGGIDPESPQHKVIVKGFFKDQATPDIRKALNSHLGYDGKTMNEILSIAKSVFNSRDERKRKDPKPDSPRKPNTNPVKWRLVQDLRLVNSFVIPRHAVVANPHHLLSTIPEGTVVYSVIDLCSAFFSIPVDPESQFLFAFTWQTGQLTWTRLPQGYVESPAIFSSILHQDLLDVALPGGSTLRLYVDDILLCGRDLESCRSDTIALLTILAHKGHKVSPKKIQYCQKEVKYLGHILGEGTRALTTDRIEAITKLPLPKTKRQLRGFIGMSRFCCAWIPRYGEFTRPLTTMTHDNAPDQLQWTAEALEAFESIKRELRSSPALGLPDYRLPFSLFVHENKAVASGVLTQPFQGRNRPVAYYSLQLDTAVMGNVGCLRAVAAAALLLEKAQETILGHDLTVNVPHAVATLLSLQGCQRFTIQRLNRYEAILLSPSNVTIKRVNSLNPVTLLPLPDDGTPHHDCSQVVRHAEKPWEDLDYLPLADPDLILYTDGSSKVVGGERKSGYAIVSDIDLLEARPVHAKYSAQAAELIALIRACELGAGQRITIYTDSKYCFGLVHATGQIWLQRGFLTAAGTQIAHAPLVERLMNSIHLPEAIAVVHCKAHTKGKDLISVGNRCADRVVQEAAL